MSSIAKKPAEPPEIQPAGPPPLLAVHPRLETKAFSFDYHLTNTRAQPIYLFNLLWVWEKTGDGVRADRPVYVCLNEPRRLQLAKVILPLPTDRQLEMRMVPFATRVEPGERYTEAFHLPLPVEEYNYYFPPTEHAKCELTGADRVVFSLAFVEHTRDLTVKPAPLPGGLRVHHPQLLSRVETIRSSPVSAQVPVRKRIDRFERF
jgi:hypothetical protein